MKTLIQIICLCVCFHLQLVGQTFVVNKTVDDGTDNTLRWAIDKVNNETNSEIHFKFEGAGPHIIVLDSDLPHINQNVRILGSTQPGFEGKPIVWIDGGNTTEAVLLFKGVEEYEVEYLKIFGFNEDGIHSTGCKYGYIHHNEINFYGKGDNSNSIYFTGGQAEIIENRIIAAEYFLLANKGIYISNLKQRSLIAGNRIRGIRIGIHMVDLQNINIEENIIGAARKREDQQNVYGILIDGLLHPGNKNPRCNIRRNEFYRNEFGVFVHEEGVKTDFVLTGSVTDNNGDPLIGATVRVDDTEIATTTDIDGNFQINVPTQSNTLIVEYAGFCRKLASFYSYQNSIKIRMVPSSTNDCEQKLQITNNTFGKTDHINSTDIELSSAKDVLINKNAFYTYKGSVNIYSTSIYNLAHFDVLSQNLVTRGSAGDKPFEIHYNSPEEANEGIPAPTIYSAVYENGNIVVEGYSSEAGTLEIFFGKNDIEYVTKFIADFNIGSGTWEVTIPASDLPYYCEDFILLATLTNAKGTSEITDKVCNIQDQFGIAKIAYENCNGYIVRFYDDNSNVTGAIEYVLEVNGVKVYSSNQPLDHKHDFPDGINQSYNIDYYIITPDCEFHTSFDFLTIPELDATWEYKTCTQNNRVVYQGVALPSWVDYEWRWENEFGDSGNESGSGTPSNLLLTPLINQYGSGIYSVRLSLSFKDCRDRFRDKIEVYPFLDASVSHTDVSCLSSPDGSISVVVTGGKPPYSISYNGTNQNNNLSPGSFKVRVEDSQGCSITPLTVNVLDRSPKLTICSTQGGCSQGVDVTFKYTVTRGLPQPTGSYRFNLRRQDNDQIVAANQLGQFGIEESITIPGVFEGEEYYMELIDANNSDPADNNCHVIFPPEIIAYPFFNLAFSVLEDKCNIDQPVDIQVNPNMTQRACGDINDFPYFIEVFDRDTDELLGSATSTDGGPVVFEDISNTRLRIFGTYDPDGFGCRKAIVPTIFPLSNMRLELFKEDIQCHGDDSGSAYVEVFRGKEAIQYVWYNLNDPNTILSTGYSVSNLPPGNYRVEVWDDIICENDKHTYDFTIEEPLELETPEITHDETSCSLSARISNNLEGPYRFDWYYYEEDNGILQSRHFESENSVVAVGTHATSNPERRALVDYQYRVKVTDSNGCIKWSDYIDINQPSFNRTYNFCVRWKTPTVPPIEENIPTPLPRETPSIIASNIQEDIRNKTEECINNHIAAISYDIEQWCGVPDSISDRLNLEYELGYYHFTLYYYDRGGNLVRTVSPKGVDISSTDRENVPYKHSFTTDYGYNSMAQLIRQKNNDSGETKFLYNDKTQLRFTQNDFQVQGYNYNQSQQKYSYTKYDKIGRVSQIGEAYLVNESLEDLENEVNQPLFPNQNIVESISYFYQNTHGLIDDNRFNDNKLSSVKRVNKNNIVVNNHFGYNSQGIVENIIQEIKGIDTTSIMFKHDYISGNINQIELSSNNKKFYHRYDYDSENRLVSINTSSDSILWLTDKRNEYFDHGPKKYSIIGQDSIQKIDYNYTLEGWIKSINGLVENDTEYPDDIYTLVINYHNNDFFKATSPFIPVGLSPTHNTELFNGIPSNYITQNLYQNNSDPLINEPIKIKSFDYDRVGRLKSSGYIQPQSEVYASNYSYDRNSNLITLTRNGDNPNFLTMDNLTIQYDGGSNRMMSVVDNQNDNSLYQNDFDNKLNSNFIYNESGFLTSDPYNNLEFSWTMDGLIDSICQAQNGENILLNQYTYDYQGNRVLKTTGENELDIYINGTNHQLLAVKKGSFDQNNITSINDVDLIIRDNDIVGLHNPTNSSSRGNIYTLARARDYLLFDYQGSFKAKFSDSLDTNGNTVIIEFEESYPFGQKIQNQSSDYGSRFGPSRMESDSTLRENGIFLSLHRLYDSKLCRWISVDPLAKEYISLSPYIYAASNPILYSDPDGRRLYNSAGAGHDASNTGYITKMLTALDVHGGIKNTVDITAHSSIQEIDANWASGYWSKYAYSDAGVAKTRVVEWHGNSGSTETYYERKPLDWRITSNVDQIKNDLKSNPLQEDDQFNLMGYSTGAVINAQSALVLADEGMKIDNLILIGATWEKDSRLQKALEENENILNIIRVDVPGDNAASGIWSVPSFISQGDEHPHFKYAFNTGADKNRKDLAIYLKQQGVADKKSK